MGMEWVDCPGIDDTPEMAALAADAAEGSDLLVWVLASRQPLTEPEMAYLTERVERSGGWNVVFLLNLIRGGGQPADAARILAALQPKLNSFWSRLEPGPGAAPQLFSIDAESLCEGDNRDVSELRSLLAELASPDHPRIRQVRAHRAAYFLSQVRESLAAERSAAGERVEAERLQAAARATELEQIRGKLQRALAEYWLSWRSAVEAELGQATTTFQLANLKGRPMTFDGSFPAELAHQCQEELVERIRELVAEHPPAFLDEESVAEARARLQPPPFGGPTRVLYSAKILQKVGLGAAGAFLLCLVLFTTPAGGVGCCLSVFLVPLGALAGAIVADAQRPRELQRAVEGTVRSIEAEVRRSLQLVAARLAEVGELLVGALKMPEPALSEAQRACTRLEDLLERLERCLSLAQVFAGRRGLDAHSELILTEQPGSGPRREETEP